MLKRYFISIILLLALCGPAWCADLDLTVGVLSDTHWFIDDDLEPAQGNLENALEIYQTYGIDYILHCGDIFDSFSYHDYDGDSTDGELQEDVQQVRDFEAVIAAGVPSGINIDFTIGNHEHGWNDTGLNDFTKIDEFVAEFSYMSALNHSRTVGDWHFIFIENVTVHPNRCADATLTWLVTELAKLETGNELADKRGILVCHYPIDHDYPYNRTYAADIGWESDDTAGDEGEDPEDQEGTCDNFSGTSGTITCDCTGWSALDADDVGEMIWFKWTAVDHTDTEWGGGYITDVTVGTPTTVTIEVPVKFTLPATTEADENYLVGTAQSVDMCYDSKYIREAIDTAIGNGADIPYVFNGHMDRPVAVEIDEGNGAVWHYTFPVIGKDECWSLVYLYSDGSIGVRNGGDPTGPAAIKSFLDDTATDHWSDYFVDFTNGNDTTTSGVYREDAFKTFLKAKTTITGGETITSFNGVNGEFKEGLGPVSGIDGDNLTTYVFEPTAVCNWIKNYSAAAWAGPDGNGWYTVASTYDVDWLTENDVFMIKGARAGAASPGQFDHDDTGNVLYYCPSSGVPAGKTLWANGTNRGVDINNIDYFAIEGLKIKGCQFGVEVRGGSDTVNLSDIDISYCFDGFVTNDATPSLTVNKIWARKCDWNACEIEDAGCDVSINLGMFTSSDKGIWLKNGTLDLYNAVLYGNDRGIEVEAVEFHGKNIIAYGNTSFDLVGDVGTSGEIDYSCIGTFSSFGGLTGEADADNIFATDPKFVNAASNDFRLKSGSPCRDAGTPIVGLTSDYRGRTVPLNGTPDIGAYEGMGRAIMLPDGTFLGYQP